MEETNNTCISQRPQLSGLLGGWRPVVNADDPAVQEAIAMVLDRANMMSNTAYRMVESRIDRLQQQVSMSCQLAFYLIL